MASYFDDHGIESSSVQKKKSQARNPHVDHFMQIAEASGDDRLQSAFRMLSAASMHAPQDEAHIALIESLFGRLLNVREGKPPASKSVLRDLPTTPVKAGTDCPICTEEFDVRESATVLPCRHLFHRPCIIPWLEVNNSCPICRDELPTDDEEYERVKREKKKAEAKKNRKDDDEDYNPLYG